MVNEAIITIQITGENLLHMFIRIATRK